MNTVSKEDLIELQEIRRQGGALLARCDRLLAKFAATGTDGVSATAAVDTSTGTKETPASPQPAAGVNPAAPPPPGDSPAPAVATAPTPSATGVLAGMKLEDALSVVLKKADRPLRFEEIYKELEQGGAALPPDKPMLVVRRTLFNERRFKTVKGAYLSNE